MFADALSGVSDPAMGRLVVNTITNLNLCCHNSFRAIKGGPFEERK